jgi:adenine-specific DNA-methyltransferase
MQAPFLREYAVVQGRGAPTSERECPTLSDPALTIPERRLLGAYYTPEAIADALVAWAMLAGPRGVLDPSYGEGVFLRSACRQLAATLRAESPSQVHGVDVDRGCERHVADLGLPTGNLTHADFLSLSPKGLPGAPFGAVVGNPPFVRHHWIKGNAKLNAIATLELAEAHIPGTASSWAYFVVHALQFLAEHGRLALVLPEAVLQADYARAIRSLLAQRFERTQLIQLRERVFADTDESVVIVLGEGRGPGALEVKSVADVAELLRVLEGAETPRHLVTTENGRTLERAAFGVLSTALKTKCVRRLGELAQIRIGFVSGANQYFIRSVSDLKELGIPEVARLPVVTRTSWLEGLTFAADDHAAHASNGARAFLIRPSEDQAGLQRWLDEGTAADVNTCHKCSDRSPWFRVRLASRAPEAFASSTRQGLPRLALNTAGYYCSNTLYMLHWSDELTVDARSIVVAYHTSLSGLWAELNGRRYGGGVLKLDPGVLQRMPIPVVDNAAGAFDEMDRLLRAGEEGKARELADDVVLAAGLGLSAKNISTLRRACASLAHQRLPQRGGRDG